MNNRFTIKNSKGSINIDYSLIEERISEYIKKELKYDAKDFIFGQFSANYYSLELNIKGKYDNLIFQKCRNIHKMIKNVFNESFGIPNIYIFVNIAHGN